MASVNGERLDTIYGVGMPHDEALGMVGRQLRLEGQLQDGATLELVSVSKSGKGEAAALNPNLTTASEEVRGLAGGHWG